MYPLSHARPQSELLEYYFRLLIIVYRKLEYVLVSRLAEFEIHVYSF
jgi:hypothetical protein